MDLSYFREAYEQDTANKARQAWEDYASWVRTFYEGKRFPPVPGWRSREQEILRALPQEARSRFEPRLAALGRMLAAEWAKDNTVRRVGTQDLQAWGRALGEAARDPAALERVLDDVSARLQR